MPRVSHNLEGYRQVDSTPRSVYVMSIFKLIAGSLVILGFSVSTKFNSLVDSYKMLSLTCHY